MQRVLIHRAKQVEIKPFRQKIIRCRCSRKKTEHALHDAAHKPCVRCPGIMISTVSHGTRFRAADINIFKGVFYDVNHDRWGVFISTQSVQQFNAPSIHWCRDSREKKKESQKPLMSQTRFTLEKGSRLRRSSWNVNFFLPTYLAIIIIKINLHVNPTRSK